jgi:hypothetical protein
VNTRQKIIVTIGISMTNSEPVAIKEPWDVHLRAKILAEDMGLEEVRIVQTLKFQGGKAPSRLYPVLCPIICKYLFDALLLQ